MQETKLEKYGTVLGIPDDFGDDPDYMAFQREDAVVRWHHMLAEQGYSPVGEPTVSLEVNIGYGWALYGPDDEPLLGADGEQLTDHNKQYLTVVGSVVGS